MAQSTPAAANQSLGELTQKNRQLVETFFQVLEAQDFEALEDLLAPDAQKLMPYAPAGVPATVDGYQAIYEQFKELPERFTRISYPRHIFTTDDPNFIFVKFSGDFDMKDGGKYENNYIGTFKLKDDKIVEYGEYFNPFLMAKAYGIKL